MLYDKLKDNFLLVIVYPFSHWAPLGLKNSMGQERLSNLALLHIEREYVIKILKEDMEKIIDTFGKRSGRNKYFFK